MSSIEEQAVTGGRRLGLALTVLACAQLVTALDFNIVYVALPEIGMRLGFSPQSLQWVFSAYSVMFGGVLLLGGRAADLFGRRRMFILGLALYASSSLLGGLAQSPLAIVAAHAIQGLGGAVLFPATVSLINTLFEEGPKRNRALGLWSLAGSSGLTLGSLVGGVLVGTLGWPSVFFVNVPIALAVALGALKAIPRDEPVSKHEGFDLPGAMTSTAGITLLVFTLVQAPEWGWASRPVLFSAAAAIVLLVLFVLIEARSASPIMPLRRVMRSGLATAMTLTFLFMGTFMALPYFTTELFQRVYRFSPLVTGFAFLVPCAATRWPERETVTDWSQGVPLAKLQALVNYWRSGYDLNRVEKRLNSFPQFRTRIDGLGVHFLHVRSKHENALPILLTHGWSGSVVEFLKVIGPLTDPTAHGGKAEDAFHVVVPSLPGFGFSDKLIDKGWNLVLSPRPG
ncbi:MFS transporter [Rhizobium miluonense]|uniref:Epoxide hydrolase N terminus n=1 Tax=Rhizobium miluonense TaxID=411945 RepID=A0A1C3WFW0_9HYPH|nr:Epoxide hydrolase N terminus [Rhizobium miluonense]